MNKAFEPMRNSMDHNPSQGIESQPDLKRDSKQGIRAIGCRALLLMFAAFAILVSPLYLHTSESPSWIGRYSTSYFSMLIIVSALAMLISFLVALRCSRSGTLRGAYTTLLFLGATLAACAVAELYLRHSANDSFQNYRIWGHKKSAILGYEAEPNHTWKAAGASYQTDEFGFRIHLGDKSWFRVEKGRIFILGGSSAFGYGLNDDETWPHLLEERLKASPSRANFHVINAGNNGHNSLQSLLRFYLTVLPKNPDFLLYYEGINDVERWILKPKSIWITENALFSDTMTSYLARERAGQNFYARTLLVYSLEKVLLKLEEAVDRVLNRGSSPAEQELTADELSVRSANGQRFITNVTTLADICRRHKVSLVLITFISDDLRMPGFYRESLKYYNQLLRDFASAEDIPLIDLEKSFSPIEAKETYFFADHYHPSQRGARWIAEVVAREMDHILKHRQQEQIQRRS
jgi:lysophospholipase L1-like esterase